MPPKRVTSNDPEPDAPAAADPAAVEPSGSAIASPEQTGPVAPADPFAHVGDEHWGKGGRYIVGADGKRVPAPDAWPEP